MGVEISGFNESSEGAVCIEVEAGDAIIHSARTIHWSRASATDRKRRAVSFFYWATSTLGDKWPGKPEMSALPSDFDSKMQQLDLAVGVAALKALDRGWATHPSVIQTFEDNAVKFLQGLKEKDEEAFDFIYARL